MKLTFHFVAVHLSFLLLADANSLRLSVPTTPDSDESRNLVADPSCVKKVVKYGTSTITIENDTESAIQEKRYLSNGAGTIKVKTYANPDNWNILSTPSLAPEPEHDPKSGECVKFGDTIVLNNAEVPSDDLNLVNKHILAAGSYSVYLTYGFVNGKEVKSKEQMEFIIRSNVGNGSRDFPDLRKGSCVEDGDKIHLQANNMDSRWINGSRNGGNVDVFSRDMLGNDYEWAAAFKNYVWIVRLNDS